MALEIKKTLLVDSGLPDSIPPASGWPSARTGGFGTALALRMPAWDGEGQAAERQRILAGDNVPGERKEEFASRGDGGKRSNEQELRKQGTDIFKK